MAKTNKLYLMLHEEGDTGQLVSGASPANAVEAHYAELDGWCAPAVDAEISEEFLLQLYEVPPALEDAARKRFEDLDSEEFAAEVAAFIAENRGVTPTEINVVYTAAEGAKASELPRMPDLLRRRNKG